VSRRARTGPAALFPVNVWPPLVDALTLVLAVFLLLSLVALVAQRSLLGRLRDRDKELTQLREDKARIERRLKALAPAAAIAVDDGKVILEGEVLFASGSDALTARGDSLMSSMGHSLAELLRAEPGQMVLVGGHTDDVPIARAPDTGAPVPPFASNWELSTARALAVSRVLIRAGIPADKVVAAGFGQHHPRAPNRDEAARAKNRRIEVLLVPIHAVSSR
jgi:flagellar motor protein MotB